MMLAPTNGRVLRRCVRFLIAMMPVRSCLCTDRECRARILALDSGTLTGAGSREAGAKQVRLLQHRHRHARVASLVKEAEHGRR